MRADAVDIREAVARIKSLPTLPMLLGQILDAAFDPDTSAIDLSRYIAADQSLSARLLRIVNSPYYGFYRKITSLTTAVVILGFAEVRNIVLTSTAFETFAHSASRYDRSQLWRHSLASAMAAERCAKILLIDIEGCFVAGLLHDIGKVTLDSVYPDLFQEAVKKAQEEGMFLRDAEMALFNIAHGEAGGVLTEHWNFPQGIVEAIQYHHEPEHKTEEPRLTSLAAMANYIAHQAGFNESGNGCEAVFPEAAASYLGMTGPQWSQIVDDIRGGEERIDTILGALCK